MRMRFTAVSVIALATLLLLRPPAVAQTVIATIPVAGGPVGIATNPVLNRIYVTSHRSNTVSVIDGATNTIIATVAVGSHPGSVAVNPVTNRIYVTHITSGTVSVIDAGTHTVTATIPVGQYPRSVDVNSATNRIYVIRPAGITEIDGTTNAVVATIPLGGTDMDVMIDPAASRVYGLTQIPGNVLAIDTTTRAVVATTPVPYPQMSLAINPTINRLYVAGWLGLIVIDGTNNTVITTIGRPGFADTGDSVAANPMTHRIYVAAYSFNQVHVFDGTTNSLLTTVPVGMSPHSVAVMSWTGRAYVTNLSSSTVSVIQDIVDAPPVPRDPKPPKQCPSWMGQNLFLCGPKDAPPMLPHCPQRPFTDPWTACPPLDWRPPLCRLVDCPPCLVALRCKGETFEILFDNRANNLAVTLFDREGKERSRMEALDKPIRIGKDEFNQRLRFRAEPDVSYYLGVAPGAETRSDVGHNLRLHLRSDKRE